MRKSFLAFLLIFFVTESIAQTPAQEVTIPGYSPSSTPSYMVPSSPLPSPPDSAEIPVPTPSSVPTATDSTQIGPGSDVVNPPPIQSQQPAPPEATLPTQANPPPANPPPNTTQNAPVMQLK